jgi:hypothetical protein
MKKWFVRILKAAGGLIVLAVLGIVYSVNEDTINFQKLGQPQETLPLLP